MKKNRFLFLLIFMALLLPSSLSAANFSDDPLQLCLSGNVFFPSDSDYKDLYGKNAFLPEVSLAYAPWKALFLWTDLGIFSQDGVISELDEEIHISRLHLGFGLGTRLIRRHSLRLSAVAGLSVQHFREEAMDTENSDSALGIKLGLQLDTAIARRWFLRLGASFIAAQKTSGDLEMKLGGFQLGAGLGFSF